MQTDFLKNGLDALVHQTLERWHVPGLALAVVSGDEVLHLAGYGQRDPARGLPAHDWIWWGSDFGRRDLLARLRHLEPNGPIRSRFQYNNVMYMLASLLVEEITGLSWERFVQERIFDIVGMKRSNFSTRTTQQDPDHARPHVYRDGPLRECPFWEQDENSVTGAAGTINSCASELATWLTLQMNAGKVGQRQFVKPETLEATASALFTGKIWGHKQSRE